MLFYFYYIMLCYYGILCIPVVFLVYFMLYVVLLSLLLYACVKYCCVSKPPCTVSITLPGNVLVSVNVSCVLTQNVLFST